LLAGQRAFAMRNLRHVSEPPDQVEGAKWCAESRAWTGHGERISMSQQVQLVAPAFDNWHEDWVRAHAIELGARRLDALESHTNR
jgi:hypothetical protein